MITEVYLLNVPIENDYKHTLYFTSKSAQETYFKSKKVANYSYDDFSFQQTNGMMRLPISYDNAVNCNYVMYKNNSKWYYAFIVEYQYHGDDQTNIKIETDVIQTWLFDYQIKPSFVEREHVTDDTIGLHTFPEGLEMGEYVVNYKYVHNPFTDLKIVVGVTENYMGELGNIAKQYNGIYSGLIYYAFDNNMAGYIALNNFIQAYADSKVSTTEAIQCMFLAPSVMCKTAHDEDSNREDYGIYSVASTDLGKINISRTKILQNKSYTPKNNKLYCYPYKYLHVSNNNGGSAIYQLEHFAINGATGSGVIFQLDGCLTPGCSIRAVPKYYKGTDAFEGSLDNDEEGINMGKYPILNWSSDVYTNWLTQNGVNIGLNLVSGLGSIVAGGAIMSATGGALGGTGVVGGITQITSQLGQIHQMSMTPPQSNGNINSGDVITASGKNSLFFYGMSIKDEYMRIIDDYFSMFGYKCNRVKVPNKNHRPGWWYTKTIDANIIGNVPQSDLQLIKTCYNNGITFWKDPDNVKNYSINNQLGI